MAKSYNITHELMNNHMNKQEKIERFRQQIDQLTKELKEFEAMQDGFKVGDWVCVTNTGSQMSGRIYELCRKGTVYRIDHLDFESGLATKKDPRYVSKEMYNCRGEGLRKATSSEIESALRSEWNRLCIEAGWDSGDEAEIEGHADGGKFLRKPNDGRCHPIYNPDTDELWIKNGLVYSSGSWATPKPRKKAVTFFEWKVNKHDGYTQIGCRDLNNNFLSVLEKELQNVSNKTVQEVLDELKKLDL